MNQEIMLQYLQNNDVKRIDLGNIKELNLLIEFLAYDNERIRTKAYNLIFKSDLIPTDKIVQCYLKTSHPFIKEIITSELIHFIPILSVYLTKDSSFKEIQQIISSIKAEEIFAKLQESNEIVPILTGLAEVALRACISSISNLNETIIDFNFIASQPKEIKKILSFMFKQSSVVTELTLLTLTKFPELTNIVVKEVRDIVVKEKSDVHVQYASLALMLIDDQKNTDVLIKRLEKTSDSIETKLAIIESLGNLGNIKASEILIKQFAKGEPLAYYAARALALLGEDILPRLILALEDDSKVPYIIESMKRLGDVSYDYLMDALQKGKKSIRKNAAQCLTLVMSEKYGYEGAIRLLTSQLAGKNPSVIEAITQALLTLGTPSIRVLIEQLAEDDVILRKNAIEVLNYFGEDNIDLALDGLLDVDSTSVVKLGLILYLYYPTDVYQNLGYSFTIVSNKLRVKNDEILEILLKAMKEIDPDIREKACDIIFHFGAKAVPPITTLLTDPNIRVRRTAVDSLRKINNKRALISLIRAAKDNDDVIAEIATRALGELKDPGVIDVIISNMKRQKLLVREAAIYAAVNIGAPIVKKLLPQLSLTNQNLVNATIEALSQMDSKILDLTIPSLRTADIKWFKNLQKVVTKMDSSAKTVLKGHYKKAKVSKTKMRLFVLVSLTRDMRLVPDIVKTIADGDSKIGVEALNNLGKGSVKSLVRELKKSSEKRKSNFVINCKGINIDILVELIHTSFKDEKLKSIAPELLKIHVRSLRRYCQINGLKYTNFVGQFSED